LRHAVEASAQTNLPVRGAAAAEPGPHAAEAEAVLQSLNSGHAGLTADEAQRRLREHGPNELPATAGRNPLLRFLAQFNNTIIYFLLAACAAAAALGHYVDAAVVLAVVLVNAFVGFVQEGKAEAALNAIRDLITPHVRVLRDGRRHTVQASEIVPGDLVLLEAGDRVPADLRLVRASSLLIDEAVLTGESLAAEKRVAPAPADAALGDRHSMAYSGTYVATGHAIGAAVATGTATEIGRIGAMLRGVETVTTPLLRQINRFGRQLTWIVLAVATVLFFFAVAFRGYGWADALLAVVALAVAAVPEGLPAVITITLAIGVQRMASRKAAIRRLPAVETLGATTVICTDKTGTLTRNEMTARRIEMSGCRLEVTGSGYAPEGRLKPLPDQEPDCAARAEPLLRAAVLCNNADLRKTNDDWHVAGDPMEGALLTLAMKAGEDHERLHAEWPRLDDIPFDAAHRFMATLNRGPDGTRHIFVKGAPEQVLAMCREQVAGETREPLDEDEWHARLAQAAAGGERLLAIAMRAADPAMDTLDFADVEEDLVLLGLVSFIDPPREEAVAAIADCRSAGIDVKMITGDHGATAAAIAKQLGLGEDPRVCTGADLDRVSDDALPHVAHETVVFARTSPAHKLRIVRALQSTGAVVAMTGDGVNDSPSLKQADIGIAMGIKGTDAAKQASQMVLLDDNFASIVAAVHEGRVVFDNIRKVIAWQLPTNGGEVLAVIAAILFNFTLPVSALQILWINLVTAATLGLVLAFEPAEPGVMRRRPRGMNEPLLTPFLVWRVIVVSLLFLTVALSFFFYARSQGADLATARTMVANVIVVLEMFYLFTVRYLHMTSFTWRGVLGTPAVLMAVAAIVVAQFAFTYLPFMQRIFDTRPLGFGTGLAIVAAGFAVMVLLEAEKALLRRMGRLAVPN
jgi:magnesium-transporting ATPase (P-type)